MTYRKRAGPLVAALAALLVVGAGSALAATVVGTPKNDVLRGTAKADKLFGKGGNDKLFGLAGNDVLAGGPGGDTLAGGPGADTLQCGAGRDTAVADEGDRVSADCELVQGTLLPAVSVGDANAPEGDSRTTTLSFPVTLSKPVTWAVSVKFTTADGSATAPGDYAAATGTITFAPGESRKTIDVTVKGDTALEPDETLNVRLSEPLNATTAGGSATGTIRNDDKAKPRSGHYAGTTSQNRQIQFDVAEDAKSLTNLKFNVDIECAEVDFRLLDDPLDFGDSRIPLRDDNTFAVEDSDSDGDVSFTISFAGAVSVSGTASGTLRVDIRVNTDSGPVRCSTDRVTWNAS